MAIKTSNKHTRGVKFSALFSRAVEDLFSSKSKKSIINYDSISLLDINQLAFLNRSQFKFFIQYVGAFSITIFLFMFTGLVFIDFRSTESLKLTDYEDISNINKQEHINVLGVYDFPSAPRAAISANTIGSSSVVGGQDALCSFTIGDIRYSNGSIFSGSVVDGFCVDYSSEVSLAMWQINTLDGNNFVSRGRCIELDNYQNLSSINVLLTGEDTVVIGSCSLKFSKIN